MMEGRINKNVKIIADPLKVVTGHSTDVMAIEDKIVASSCHFINENSRFRQIRIDEIAKQAGVSRRTLEIRFRKVLNKTVHEVITDLRIKRFKQLLTEFNLTISEVAMETGCSGTDSFCRIFKKQTGLTPLIYRKHNISL